MNGPSRPKFRLSGQNVKIVLISESEEQRDQWVEQIRALVAPFELFKSRMKELAVRIKASGLVEDLRNEIGRMFVNSGLSGDSTGSNPETRSEKIHDASLLQDIVTDEWIERFAAFPEQLQKLDWADKLNVQAAAIVGIATTAVGLAEKTGLVAETAKFVADMSKCVAGASTAFQLVVLAARLISMFAEAERGRRALPKVLDRGIVLLRSILRSLVRMLVTSTIVDGNQEDYVFRSLQQTVDCLGQIESYLMSGGVRQFFKSKLVKDIESTMTKLEDKAQIVSNTSDTRINREKIKDVTERFAEFEGEGRHPSEDRHHPRPALYPFFVGRTDEMDRLEFIVRKRGSAVISQYGGAGKTELMVAFSMRLEKKDEVSGGVFWLTLDGGRTDAVQSLGTFVEKFMRRKLTKDERNNPNFLLAELKRGLSDRDGRWLLCLDNADDRDLSGVLDEICAIAEPSKQNGWVVVTSRQGTLKMWNRMKSDQKLVLQPLSERDAMVVLWRHIYSFEISDVSDDTSMAEINEMREQNPTEYDALEEICGNKSAHSLGGLPLALVQAGSYIGQFECSFKEYLELLMEGTKKNLNDILERSQQLSQLNEAQRSILTTWNISVGLLSDEAYCILRALSMLGTTPIPKVFVMGILENVSNEEQSVRRMFQVVFMKELVHGSSLICREDGKEGHVFGMHRLVRRFVQGEMEEEIEARSNAYGAALLSVHRGIGQVLAKEGNSFANLPKAYGEYHRIYLSHVQALLDPPSLSVSSADELWAAEDIFSYIFNVFSYFGNVSGYLSVIKNMTAFSNHNVVEDEQLRSLYQLRTGLFDVMVGLLDEWNPETMLPLFKRSLKLCRNHESENPQMSTPLIDIFEICSKIWAYYIDGDDQVDIESVRGRLAKSQEAIEGTENLPEALYLGFYGVTLLFEGKLEEVEPIFRRCLGIISRVYGEEFKHPFLSCLQVLLGHVYLDLEKIDDAEKMFLESQKTSLPDGGPLLDICKFLQFIGLITVGNNSGTVSNTIEVAAVTNSEA